MSTAFDEGTRPVGMFGRLADLVLTSDDADQSVRWTPRERLNHLFEQRRDQGRARGLQPAGRGPVGLPSHEGVTAMCCVPTLLPVAGV